MKFSTYLAGATILATALLLPAHAHADDTIRNDSAGTILHVAPSVFGGLGKGGTGAVVGAGGNLIFQPIPAVGLLASAQIGAGGEKNATALLHIAFIDEGTATKTYKNGKEEATLRAEKGELHGWTVDVGGMIDRGIYRKQVDGTAFDLKNPYVVAGFGYTSRTFVEFESKYGVRATNQRYDIGLQAMFALGKKADFDAQPEDLSRRLGVRLHGEYWLGAPIPIFLQAQVTGMTNPTTDPDVEKKVHVVATLGVGFGAALSVGSGK
jgi:hypothetical protein